MDNNPRMYTHTALTCMHGIFVILSYKDCRMQTLLSIIAKTSNLRTFHVSLAKNVTKRLYCIDAELQKKTIAIPVPPTIYIS